MVKLTEKYSSLASYKAGYYRRCIASATADLISLPETHPDRGVVQFYYAMAHYRIGQQFDALSGFRTALEANALPDQHRAACLINMGVISLNIGDQDFSRSCLESYRRMADHDGYVARMWEGVLQVLAGHSEGWREQFETILETDLAQSAHFGLVHCLLGICCLLTGEFDQAARVAERLGGLESTQDFNLLHALFEHYCAHDPVRAEAVSTRVAECGLNERTRPVHRYMLLRLKEARRESAEDQLHLANDILEECRQSFDPGLGQVVEYCSALIREHAPQTGVMVPSKYGIVGISPAVMSLRIHIERYARSESPVLIIGDSGTGKELTALALHEASPRRAKPFVTVNCPAIPEGVFESALFGHVNGAFTGARRDHAGLIEQASGGTLFFDEVGDLPPALQSKLLRFLESGEFRRVGSEQTSRCCARIIAATNRDLSDPERFRNDLYHRLRKLVLVLPSLCDRGEDVRYLARHRVEVLNRRAGDIWKTLAPPAEQALQEREYPGNVRDLFNVVDRAWHDAVQIIGAEHIGAGEGVALIHGDLHMKEMESSRAQIPVSFSEEKGWRLDFSAAEVPLRKLQDKAAVLAVRQAMEHFNGNVDETARFLGVSRRSVYRYLQKEREFIEETGPEA